MSEFTAKKTRTESLKNRKKRCCCKFCGGKLSLKRISFSQFEADKVELYCEHCNRIEFGVEPEIYHSAENFVDELDFNYYSDINDYERNRQMSIAKICEIIAWSFKDLGLTDIDGFTIPINKEAHHWEECLVVDDKDLEAINCGKLLD